MAKIYETDQDVAREKTWGNFVNANKLTNFGMETALFGLALLGVNFLVKKMIPAERAAGFLAEMRKNTNPLMYAGGVIAALGGATTVVGRVNSAKYENEMRKLGPEEIIGVEQASDYIATKSDHLKRLQEREAVESSSPRNL